MKNKQIQFIEEPQEFTAMQMNNIRGGFCSENCFILAGKTDIMMQHLTEKVNALRERRAAKGKSTTERQIRRATFFYSGPGGLCINLTSDNYTL